MANLCVDTATQMGDPFSRKVGSFRLPARDDGHHVLPLWRCFYGAWGMRMSYDDSKTRHVSHTPPAFDKSPHRNVRVLRNCDRRIAGTILGKGGSFSLNT